MTIINCTCFIFIQNHFTVHFPVDKNIQWNWQDKIEQEIKLRLIIKSNDLIIIKKASKRIYIFRTWADMWVAGLHVSSEGGSTSRRANVPPTSPFTKYSGFTTRHPWRFFRKYLEKRLFINNKTICTCSHVYNILLCILLKFKFIN